MNPYRIHITGDYICDWNISRPDYIPDGYFDRSDETQIHIRGGGAWYLEHLISSVSCADLTGPDPGTLPKVSVITDRKLTELETMYGLPTDNVRNIAHAYSLWTRVDRESGAKSKPPKVWRVNQLLGSRAPGTEFAPNPPFDRPADLLVIDNLNLGYAENENCQVWEALASNGPVVLKHGATGPQQPFWEHIVQAFGDRLTVVISATALRARNASLTRASSWDRTLSDIQSEFATGASSRDLARASRVVVHYGASAVAVFEKKDLVSFVFRPDELEGTWEESHPGKTFGGGSILTAALVRHLVHPASYPLFTAMVQALSAHRRAHLVGGGMEPILNVDLAYGSRPSATAAKGSGPAARFVKPITKMDYTKFKNDKSKKAAEEYPFLAALDDFRAAWNPRKMPVWRAVVSADPCNSCGGSRLLCNVTGPYQEALISIAAEVVRRGIDKALDSVPKARYGNFISVDRREVESINEIRRLILNYRDDAHAKRPLSIAVFGAPGSGKSFAIKEVSQSIFGDKKPLEFNLSQMDSPEDLHRAFHQVRDASIRQEIPLVFWDEFDAGGLKWLASFLAPMNDAEFFDGSLRHPFGKAIFIFAGGTCKTFEEFRRWRPPEKPEASRGKDSAERVADGQSPARFPSPTPICDDCAPPRKPGPNAGRHDDAPPSEPSPNASQEVKAHPEFVALKGTDFVGRLRGFVDILGPNRVSPSDHTHVLRRALILRSEIERQHPELIGPGRVAQISPDIIEAFLTVDQYRHGARSVSAVLEMSSLAGEHTFTKSALPPEHILALHVSNDFLGEARGLPPDVTEGLAKAGHAGWRAAKEKQGYTYGEVRNDDPTKPPLTNPDLCDWEKLSSDSQQGNRDCVPGRILILRRLGCTPTPVDDLASQFSGEEHLRWWSDRLVRGWAYGPTTQDHLRTHTDICPFANLSDDSKFLNVSIAKATIRELERCGYGLK